MRKSTMLVALLAMTFAACATDDGDYGDGSVSGPSVHKFLCPNGCSGDVDQTLKDGQWLLVGKNTFQRADTVVEGSSVCQAAASAQGACAFACEPDQFVETIPLGTCAAAHCQMADGGEVIVGGCHR